MTCVNNDVYNERTKLKEDNKGSYVFGIDKMDEIGSGYTISMTEENEIKPFYSGPASFHSCVVNLLNTVVGAGMLGLPSAFAGSGYIGGTVFLCIASFFSAMGLRLLAISAETVGVSKEHPSSFYTVANAAYPQFTSIIDLAVALKCFGVATGYFVTVGDCMVDAFEYLLSGVTGRHQGGRLGSFDWNDILISRHFWILMGLLSVAPISFFKTLDALRGTSTLSLALIYSLVIMIVLYAQGVFNPCLGYSATHSGDLEITWKNTDPVDSLNLPDEVCTGQTFLFTSFSSTFKNLSIFVFSFTCHQNIFPVVNELSHRTKARVDGVVGVTVSSALLLYLIVSYEGYRTYGSQVKGDILLNYPQTLPVTIMRIFIAIMVMLSYPLQLDPSRRCITSLVYSIQQLLAKTKTPELILIEKDQYSSMQATGDGSLHLNDIEMKKLIEKTKQYQTSSEFDLENTEEDNLKNLADSFLFNGITCSFLVLSFTIAMLVSDLGLVLSVVGATGSTVVSYILPGLIYLKLHPHMHFLKVIAYLQLTLGLIIVPCALYHVFKGDASE